jgi:hypothetical protein
MKARRLMVAVMLAWMPVLHAAAQPPTAGADWPCQQIKVPEMSVAAMWGGPPLEMLPAGWRNDTAVVDLVERLSERRLPLEQAQAMIERFAAASGPQRRERLSALLLGLFEVMNRQRSAVLTGLERFGHRQRDLAQALRTGSETLANLQAGTARDETALDKQREQLVWQRRVFDERRQTLSLVCEVPGRIEQRLFALTRTIQQTYQ